MCHLTGLAVANLKKNVIVPPSLSLSVFPSSLAIWAAASFLIMATEWIPLVTLLRQEKEKKNKEEEQGSTTRFSSTFLLHFLLHVYHFISCCSQTEWSLLMKSISTDARCLPLSTQTTGSKCAKKRKVRDNQLVFFPSSSGAAGMPTATTWS